jgi:hypothetical protein
MSAVEERVGAYLKKDWKKAAMDILEQRISTGEGEVFRNISLLDPKS